MTETAVQNMAAQNTAVINPYALAELVVGHPIKWKEVADVPRFLEDILQTPYEELFDRWLPTTVCSSSYRPLDTWQYLTVDAVAGTDRITVFLVSSVTEGSAAQTYISWDDTYLGVAPIAATPTPVPPPPPARPQPIPFTPHEMVTSMNELRATLENMGGLLDRLYQGTGGTCAEFEAYYRQLIVSKTYHSIPGAWQTIYNDYLWAAEQALATNDAIYGLCTGEGRSLLTFFNYSVGRTGINDSLSRLIPAIEAANALLNQ
jgi:hypothetical protein